MLLQYKYPPGRTLACEAVGPCSSWGKPYGSTSLRDDPKSWRGARERADPWRKAEGIKSSEPCGCGGTSRAGGDGTVLRGGDQHPKKCPVCWGEQPTEGKGGQETCPSGRFPKAGGISAPSCLLPIFLHFSLVANWDSDAISTAATHQPSAAAPGHHRARGRHLRGDKALRDQGGSHCQARRNDPP